MILATMRDQTKRAAFQRMGNITDPPSQLGWSYPLPLSSNLREARSYPPNYRETPFLKGWISIIQMELMIQLHGWPTVNTISTIKVVLPPSEITKISSQKSCKCGPSNCPCIRQIKQGLVKPNLKMIDFNRVIQIMNSKVVW